MRGSLPLFLVRRLLALAVTVVAAPTVAFVVFNGLSGSLGASVPVAAWRYMVTTYWHHDLGTSNRFRTPIAEVLRATMPFDAAMVVGAVVLGLLLGIGGGLLACARGGWPDRLLQGTSALILACPPYWLGFMVLILFAPGVGYVFPLPFVSTLNEYGDPHTLLGWIHELWVPCLVVALPLAAQLLRMTVACVREAEGEDFLRTARAKGLTEWRILRRHSLPLALTAVSTLTAANMAMVITNVTLVEYAFNLPGLFGQIRDIVVSAGDWYTLQGAIIEATVLIVVANMLADALQARLDPTVHR